MKVRVFETGTGVGGTWYWNRYPGARFDSESYSYGFSFSQELLDEWHWTGALLARSRETLKYLNFVADKFDLRRDIQFKSRVTAAHWKEETQRLGDHAGGRQPPHLALPDHRHRARFRRRPCRASRASTASRASPATPRAGRMSR